MKKKEVWGAVLAAVIILSAGKGVGGEPRAAEEQETENQSAGAGESREQETENQSAETGELREQETENPEGERRASIRVVAIEGNELTYYEITEDQDREAETRTDQMEISGQTELSQEAPQGENAAPGRSGSFNSSQKGEFEPSQSGGFDPGQSGDFDPGQMEDFTPGQSGGSDSSQAEDFDSAQGERGGETSGADSQSSSDRGFSGGRSFRGGVQSMETKTVYLPVPVVVHTDTEEKMTFSILQAGDELEVLLVKGENQEEIITEIWMKSEEGAEE